MAGSEAKSRAQPAIATPFRIAIRSILRSTSLTADQLCKMIREEDELIIRSYPPKLLVVNADRHEELARWPAPIDDELARTGFWHFMQTQNLSARITIETVERIGLYASFSWATKPNAQGRYAFLLQPSECPLECDWFCDSDCASSKPTTICSFDSQRLVELLNESGDLPRLISIEGMFRLLHWYYFQNGPQSDSIDNSVQPADVDTMLNSFFTSLPIRLVRDGWDFFKPRGPSSLRLQDRLRISKALARGARIKWNDETKITPFQCVYLVRLIGLSLLNFTQSLSLSIRSVPTTAED